MSILLNLLLTLCFLSFTYIPVLAQDESLELFIEINAEKRSDELLFKSYISNEVDKISDVKITRNEDAYYHAIINCLEFNGYYFASLSIYEKSNANEFIDMLSIMYTSRDKFEENIKEADRKKIKQVFEIQEGREFLPVSVDVLASVNLELLSELIVSSINYDFFDKVRDINQEAQRYMNEYSKTN